MKTIGTNIIRAIALCVVTLVFSISLTYIPGNDAEAVPTCVVKACMIQGKACVCCLQLTGAFTCNPCGQVDCT